MGSGEWLGWLIRAQEKKKNLLDVVQNAWV